MRWKILFALFIARLSMAFQFAAVGALAPIYESTFAVSSADLGILIGIYFIPGILIALPGGALGARFEDKRVVMFGMIAMILGAALMATATHWGLQLTGRFLAGIGGVFVNVLMTKMVSDWFEGKELATALAIFLNSWPAGIGLALAVLPAIASAFSLSAAVLVIAGVVGIGLVLTGTVYRAPQRESTSIVRGTLPKGARLWAACFAGMAWGLFNAAFGIFFSFAPANLVERGWSLIDASAMSSVVVWVVMLAGMAGGAISDATGRPFTLVLLCSVFMLFGFAGFPYVEANLFYMIGLGILIGLPVGTYVSLGATSLLPHERALGMGIFFTIYYVIFTAGPPVAGWMIDRYETTNAAFAVASLSMAAVLICVMLCARYQGIERRTTIAG